MIRNIFVIIILFFVTNLSFAQRQDVSEQDILFQTEMIRAIDLNWSSSQEVFGEDKIIPVILYDAAIKGEITAFSDNSLKDSLTTQELLDKLITCDFDTCYQFMGPEQIYELELGEDLVFDKHRTEHYFVAKFLALYIPERLNPRGLKEPWAVFKFEDVAKVFRKDARAWSQDRLIGGRKVNYADLFTMKAFYTEIIKIGHAHDMYFDQRYASKLDAFLEAKDAEYQIINFLYKIYNPN